MKPPTSVIKYNWMAFRSGFTQVMGWHRAKDMKRDIIALGGEWDIFKKVGHRVCRKKVVLESEAGYWDKDQT